MIPLALAWHGIHCTARMAEGYLGVDDGQGEIECFHADAQ